MRPRVLFICTGNACRSQMAEGWLRHLAADEVEAASAGVIQAGVHPLAIQVMAEAGVDIVKHQSKLISKWAGREFDYVITLCDHARDACPAMPNAGQRLHWPFTDPVGVHGGLDERLAAFRQTRDLIRLRIASWLRQQPFQK